MAVPINVASIPWFDPHGEQNFVAHRLEKWLTVDFGTTLLICQLHLTVSQPNCELLHNLHIMQKAIHWRNRKTIRRPIPRTPTRR